MFSPNGIRAILFDLDGTLRHHIPEGGDLFTDHAISLGLPIHEEDRLRAKRWEHYYFASSPEIRSDSALFKEKDKFWVVFGRRRLIALGSSPAQADELAPQLSAHMREHYKPQVHVPPESRALLADLKAAGFTLGVVSNRDEVFNDELKNLGLADSFHFTLAGGEVQSYKPDPGIFEEALRRAGTSAPETMYIGDNYFADVVGALRSGLRPVLYDPSGLFPDAECDVIQNFNQLPNLLK